MQISTIKYADLSDQKDADAHFNGSEMLILSISVSAYCNRSTNTLLAIASAMQISTIKYADLNETDADFNGSEMLICRFQCRHNLLFDQQIRCLQLHQRCRFQGSNMLISTIREGSEMLICRFQCRHFILFDQQYIGEGGFLSAAGNGAVQNNF